MVHMVCENESTDGALRPLEPNISREIRCRTRRQISLVCLTGIAGIVAYCGALIAYGVVERHRGQFLGEAAISLFSIVSF